MEIKLDEQMMRGLVSEALLKSLDEKQRELLISGAIQLLLTPEKPAYGGGRAESEMEKAFRFSVSNVAQRIVSERLADDVEFKVKINALLNEALVLVMETNRETTVKQIAEAITKGLAFTEQQRY